MNYRPSWCRAVVQIAPKVYYKTVNSEIHCTHARISEWPTCFGVNGPVNYKLNMRLSRVYFAFQKYEIEKCLQSNKKNTNSPTVLIKNKIQNSAFQFQWQFLLCIPTLRIENICFYFSGKSKGLYWIPGAGNFVEVTSTAGCNLPVTKNTLLVTEKQGTSANSTEYIVLFCFITIIV